MKLEYDHYREQARAGDILEWEPDGFFDLQGRAIADGTHGPYKHTSIVLKMHDRLMQAGYHAIVGGAITPLSAEVRRHSGKIHVYRVIQGARHGGEPADVQRGAISQIGGDYSMLAIRLIAFGHLLLGKLLLRLPKVREWYAGIVNRASSHTANRICSQYVHSVWRTYGDVTLCPGVAEALISPNDIAKSQHVTRLGTLVWPEKWRHKA